MNSETSSHSEVPAATLKVITPLKRTLSSLRMTCSLKLNTRDEHQQASLASDGDVRLGSEKQNGRASSPSAFSLHHQLFVLFSTFLLAHTLAYTRGLEH